MIYRNLQKSFHFFQQTRTPGRPCFLRKEKKEEGENGGPEKICDLKINSPTFEIILGFLAYRRKDEQGREKSGSKIPGRKGLNLA
jgi:hypothetical protein